MTKSPHTKLEHALKSGTVFTVTADWDADAYDQLTAGTGTAGQREIIAALGSAFARQLIPQITPGWLVGPSNTTDGTRRTKWELSLFVLNAHSAAFRDAYNTLKEGGTQ